MDQKHEEQLTFYCYNAIRPDPTLLWDHRDPLRSSSLLRMYQTGWLIPGVLKSATGLLLHHPPQLHALGVCVLLVGLRSSRQTEGAPSGEGPMTKEEPLRQQRVQNATIIPDSKQPISDLRSHRSQRRVWNSSSLHERRWEQGGNRKRLWNEWL